MFKSILTRFFFGFCLASTIGTIVNLIISAAVGSGEFTTVTPILAEHFSTELDAVTAQFFMIGLIGVAFAEGSMLFDIEHWSFLKQCIVHFFVTAIFYIPFAYICWIPLNTAGVLALLGNIILTYGINWLIQYRANCRNVSAINKKIREVRENACN